MDDETTHDKDVSRILLIVEQRYFSGTLMRFRYHPIAIIRRAVLWGAFFAIFWVGLFTIRGSMPGSPSILNVGIVSFSFAASLSLLKELQWRFLKITDEYVSLHFTGGRVNWKSRQDIKYIDVLSHSGSNIALRIHWKENDTDDWIVSGTMVGKNYCDLINVFEDGMFHLT